MTRIIVHAGFYKTGTTSLQTHLARNGTTLRPWFDYYGQNDFHHAGAAARIYGQYPFPWRLRQFRAAFRSFLHAIPDADCIVLSRESFVGAMPGHRNWMQRPIIGFPNAARLLATISAELTHRFGPEVQVETLFTTRARDAWLQSVHGHLLRSIRLTDDFDTFAARFVDLPNLATQAQRLGATHIRAMEDFAHHHNGPAGAVLDLAGVPTDVQADLPAAARKNIGQAPDLAAAFLALNRSGKSKTTLKRLKNDMLREARA